MKQLTEQMTQNALRLLMQTLERNVKDTDVVLTRFEDCHDDAEVCNSRNYNALLAGHKALKEAIERINHQLNK